MISVHSCRKKYHQSIRLQQLSQKFTQVRILLRQLSSQQALEILHTWLNNFISSILSKSIESIKINLIQLSSVASQYSISDFLIKQVNLPIELQQGSHGSFPKQCSIINILLILLDQYEPSLWEECSALLHYSFYQIRKKIEKKQYHQYQAEIQRILQNFPMRLLLTTEIKVCLNLLDALQQLIQIQESHQILFQFIQRRGILIKTLNNLYLTNFFSIIDIQERVINTSLMTLSIISKHRLLNSEIQQLSSSTKNILISNIEKGYYSDILFKKIKALILSNILLTDQEWLTIQEILLQQVQQHSIAYVQMVNTIVKINQFTLSSKSIECILYYLFKEIKHENQLYLRQWLAILIFNNILLIKKWLFINLEFEEVLSQYRFTGQLTNLVFIAKERRQNLYILLIEIIWFIWQFMNFPMQIYYQQLSFLQQYPQWQILLKKSSISFNSQIP